MCVFQKTQNYYYFINLRSLYLKLGKTCSSGNIWSVSTHFLYFPFPLRRQQYEYLSILDIKLTMGSVVGNMKRKGAFYVISILKLAHANFLWLYYIVHSLHTFLFVSFMACSCWCNAVYILVKIDMVGLGWIVWGRKDVENEDDGPVNFSTLEQSSPSLNTIISFLERLIKLSFKLHKFQAVKWKINGLPWVSFCIY